MAGHDRCDAELPISERGENDGPTDGAINKPSNDGCSTVVL